MIELKKLNVHRIVATREEASALTSKGYEIVNPPEKEKPKPKAGK